MVSALLDPLRKSLTPWVMLDMLRAKIYMRRKRWREMKWLGGERRKQVAYICRQRGRCLGYVSVDAIEP